MQLSISIVSHGQGALVEKLLGDLRRLTLPSYEVLLTINVPEDEAFVVRHANLPLRVIRNERPKGFGANHNAAFKCSTGAMFAIVNPDVRLVNVSLSPLFELVERPNVGLAAPAVYSSDGKLQDSARRFPTLRRMLLRKLRGEHAPDYEYGNEPVKVDWCAGMFMLLRREVFAHLGGFDERFYMYLEDADLCRRIAAAGLDVMIEPRVAIVHDAQRASRRDPKHLRWHMVSVLRYFSGL